MRRRYSPPWGPSRSGAFSRSPLVAAAPRSGPGTRRTTDGSASLAAATGAGPPQPLWDMKIINHRSPGLRPGAGCGRVGMPEHSLLWPKVVATTSTATAAAQAAGHSAAYRAATRAGVAGRDRSLNSTLDARSACMTTSAPDVSSIESRRFSSRPRSCSREARGCPTRFSTREECSNRGRGAERCTP